MNGETWMFGLEPGEVRPRGRPEGAHGPLRAMRRTLVWFSACAAVSALLLLGGAGTAMAKGRVAKGFAYAAEVSVSVEYDATFTQDAVNDEPCGDANGNTIHQHYTSHEEEDLDRTVQFKHITVPVVPAWKLGAAAGRLALKPTITDAGTVHQDHTTYDLSGTLIGQDSCPATTTEYDCPGTIFNPGKIDSVLISRQDGFDAEVFELPVFSGQIADPLTCGANGANDIANLLGIAASEAHPGWAEVILHSNINPHLYELRRKARVGWTVPVDGATPCSGNGQVSCTQTVSGHATVTIKRRFLYRTKRSYAK
jgi:hypothetical protein